MAITRDHAATLISGGGSTTVITWPTLPTAGAKVLAGFTLANALTPTSVVDNGTSPTTFTLDYGPGAGLRRQFIYRADNITLPSAGSYKVTVTWPSASGGVTAQGVSYLGAAPGGPASTSPGTGVASSSVTTNNATPAAAGALFFATFADNSGANPETITLTGAGFTGQGTQTNGAANICAGFADKIDAGGPTATACTWTLGDSVTWYAAIAAYDATPVSNPLTLSTTVAAAGSQSIRAGKILTGAVTATGGAVRAISRTLMATVTATGKILRGIGRILKGAVTAAGALTFPQPPPKVLPAVITITPAGPGATFVTVAAAAGDGAAITIAPVGNDTAMLAIAAG